MESTVSQQDMQRFYQPWGEYRSDAEFCSCGCVVHNCGPKRYRIPGPGEEDPVRDFFRIHGLPPSQEPEELPWPGTDGLRTSFQISPGARFSMVSGEFPSFAGYLLRTTGAHTLRFTAKVRQGTGGYHLDLTYMAADERQLSLQHLKWRDLDYWLAAASGKTIAIYCEAGTGDIWLADPYRLLPMYLAEMLELPADRP